MTALTHSAPAERSFLGLSATGFHRIAYTEWGTGPRTVVCVHGLTRNGRDFDLLAEHLAGALGVRVACPDVVGRGRSDRLANPDLYGYPQYLADMAGLLARLDVESVDWVGTSMGGLIGMLLAAQPNSPIRRLVINDVGPFVPKAALERLALYVGKDPVYASLDEVVLSMRTNYEGFGKLTDEQWLHLATHSTVRQPDGSYRLAYDPGIARIFSTAPIGDVDFWPVWNAIRCPVLLIRGGASDLLLPETAERMCKEGPKATLVTVPDTGHAPALMEASQIAAVADFLRHA
ncbi:MAG TPA: alpha/beta hydrolase [Azospirillaceae bacterium]|nr:alpha/beta hydrolase [Azospirillaceae bacterium]